MVSQLFFAERQRPTLRDQRIGQRLFVDSALLDEVVKHCMKQRLINMCVPIFAPPHYSAEEIHG